MGEFETLIDKSYLGNTAWQWLIALAILVSVFFGLLLLRRVIQAQHRKLAATPQVELLELPLSVASRTTLLFITILSLFLALQAVELPAKVSRLFVTAITISAFWQAGLWITTAVLGSLERKRAASMGIDRAVVGTLGIIGFIARVIIWSFVLLLTLDNLGIEIKPLLAGLGIGGLAVALAVQNILGDLLASLTIALDRPFVVGDSLSVDEFSGTVEYIGVKSTRLRSTSGEQIIIPNANLLSSRLRNNARMSQRRVAFIISLSQDTSPTQLRQLPSQIRALIESYDEVRFDRSHFAKITASAFDVESVYFVLKPDYGLYMDIQQGINLRLLELMESEGLEFASPSQRLWLEGDSRIRSELVPSATDDDKPLRAGTREVVTQETQRDQA